jgi:hypothetical protein
MKALYAYFGLLDLHHVDSPGHSLYQLGLIDSLKKSFGCKKFDFFSYYPAEVQLDAARPDSLFPNTPLGSLFQEYRLELIEDYCITQSTLMERISEKKYDKLFLKARFRNLSTLAKKWKDARAFEKIIETALSAGYSRENIIILDTDLSLSDDFFQKYGSLVSIVTPSITIPGVSTEFLKRCVEIHSNDYNKNKLKTFIFYGNIDTSNYKAGNEKSAILPNVIEYLTYVCMPGQFTVISKAKDASALPEEIRVVARADRPEIWKTLENGLVMINVTKEKYDNNRFIPARIFEAFIFGMIPVSYKFSFLGNTFSFENMEDLDEIVKYLMECSTEDLKKAYLHSFENYLKQLSDIHNEHE